MPVSAPSFRHEVAFYDDEDAYLETTIPFLREGLEAGEAIMVALGPEKTELLQGELGADAGGVCFQEMEEFGRNPARLIPAWREFVDERQADGARCRGLGEPVWPGRDPAEVDECLRHEALLNLAFGSDQGVAMLCPYNSIALPDSVLQQALEHHPRVAGRGGACMSSPAWDDANATPDPFAGNGLVRPSGTEEFRYGVEDLHDLRAFAARVAADAGLSDERAEDLILAASEIAANSIVHGGGGGSASAWSAPGAVLFETRDRGHIDEPLVGRVRPTAVQTRGRGLWMANQLCDLVQIRSSEAGTTVRLRVELD